jgi:transglutaminase-like putative cysteine protease
MSALCAVLVVQFFRIDQHRSIVLMVSEVASIASLAFLICFFTRRWVAANKNNLNQVQAIGISQLGTVVVVAVFFVWQWGARAKGLGDANEIVALLTLQYVTLFLALVGFVPGYDRASLALSGALVFFVCCMTQRFEIFIFAGAFTVIALWGLLGLYWSRLDPKAIDGQSKMLSIHGSSIGIASLLMLLAIAMVCLIPMSDAATALRGFMPFSGGKDGYQDPFARNGVGDGDMLTGGDNATTTGAVDTDQFIEDHRPSLYDVMSEKYDGPVTKRPRNRAVALKAVSKHMHQLKQSEMAGKTFRTIRKSGKPSNKHLKNRITDALFFVEGAVPARFATTHFQHFDGWDWTTVDSNSASPHPPEILLKKLRGKPVFSLKIAREKYLADTRTHRLKFMRLETNCLPAPPFLQSWHIARVDQVDFFDWTSSGQIQFDGDFIPPQTVVDIQSLIPNYHLLRERSDSPTSPRSRDRSNHYSANRDAHAPSPYLQIPAKNLSPSIDLQIDSWVDGIDGGWDQVESIVSHLRNDFELNNAWQVDPDADNSVDQFLHQQGGPEYMFATTCAIALRKAGYKTRLSSGFVVRESDFDWVSKQSVITGDNVHMWPEVCLDGQFWIPVEPTPGYPQPYSVETLWQRLMAGIASVSRWIYHHPILTLSGVVAAWFAVALRMRLVTAGLLVWWHVVRMVWASALLSTTRRLIDARFWAAGIPRPASQTIRRWYLQVDAAIPGRFFELWDLQNFGDATSDLEIDAVVASCREQVQLLTYQKIKQFHSESRMGECS